MFEGPRAEGEKGEEDGRHGGTDGRGRKCGQCGVGRDLSRKEPGWGSRQAEREVGVGIRDQARAGQTGDMEVEAGCSPLPDSASPPTPSPGPRSEAEAPATVGAAQAGCAFAVCPLLCLHLAACLLI